MVKGHFAQVWPHKTKEQINYGNITYQLLDNRKNQSDLTMKNTFVLSIIFLFLLFCSACLSGNKYKKMNEEANKLYKAQDYPQAFELFKTACEKGNIPESCFEASLMSKNGIGTKQNNDISHNMLNKLLKNNEDVSQLYAAFLLEYVATYIDDNINKSYNIYNKLKNSKNSVVIDHVNKALKRLPTYIFLNELIPITKKYKSKNINYHTYRISLENINTNNITPDIREAFYAFRDSCLASEKQANNFLLDYSMMLGKIFIGGFTGGALGLLGVAPDFFQQIKDFSNVSDSCKNDTIRFYNVLDNEGISRHWINSLQ